MDFARLSIRAAFSAFSLTSLGVNGMILNGIVGGSRVGGVNRMRVLKFKARLKPGAFCHAKWFLTCVIVKYETSLLMTSPPFSN